MEHLSRTVSILNISLDLCQNDHQQDGNNFKSTFLLFFTIINDFFVCLVH